MQVLALLDLIVTSSVVDIEAGTLQAEDELRTRLARHEFPISFSLAHSIPSTEGIINL